jgi:uncharacterized damage-inducible protein DinB
MEATKLLKHMAWANEKILRKVSDLPDEALDSYIINPEWTVREIACHIASSATWYGYRLLDKSNFSQDDHAAWDAKLEETEIAPEKSIQIERTIEILRLADNELLKAAQLPEGVVVREMDGKIITRARSTVISQAIHHATEHRAQLVSALEFRGFNTINLDDYDLWAFAETIGE